MDLDDRDKGFDFPAWVTGWARAYTLCNEFTGNHHETAQRHAVVRAARRPHARTRNLKIMAAIPLTTSVATRGWTIMKRVVIFLSSVIAIVSYRYLFGSGAVPSTVLANRYFYGWALVHAASSATALLIGPLQFVARLRQRRPAMHRAVGITYVTACLAGGLSALPLAMGSVAGPLASAGFIALGTAWMAATVIAVHRIATGQVAAHRRWMIRSFALTLSALTLRIYLFVSGLLDMDYFVAYPVIAWVCWLPNILGAEWYLRYGRDTR